MIAVTEDGHFVLERQYRHGLGKTCYEIPAGVIEEGESPALALFLRRIGFPQAEYAKYGVNVE